MPLHFDRSHVFGDKVKQLEREIRGKDEKITALSTENAMLHLQLAEQQGRVQQAYRECAYYSRLAQHEETKRKNLAFGLSDLHTSIKGLKQELYDTRALMLQMATQMSEILSAADLSKISQLQLSTDQKTELTDVKQKLVEATSAIQKLSDAYSKEKKRRKDLHNTLMELNGNIRVQCRVRPIMDFDVTSGHLEGSASHKELITSAVDDETVLVKTSKYDHNFEFDRVYGPSETQMDIFQEVAPMLTSLLDGYNACIMAYGQTGSGKTYTMLGDSKEGGYLGCHAAGIIPRAASELFRLIKEQSSEYSVDVSVIEVYNNEISDLLGRRDCGKHEIIMGPNGCLITPTVICRQAQSAEDIISLVELGLQKRCESATQIHEHSSRSHLVVTLTVTIVTQVSSQSHLSRKRSHKDSKDFPRIPPKSPSTGRVARSKLSPSKSNVKDASMLTKQVTKLQLVDLAGSECVGMSGVTGLALRETSNINKSLCALSDVLAALAEQRSHIPYRNSRLTHLLQDSIGGDAKLLMMLCVSPAQRFITQSLQCLEFGQRARQVQRGPAQRHISQPLKRSSSMDNCYSGVVKESGQVVRQRPRSASTRQDYHDLSCSLSTVSLD